MNRARKEQMLEEEIQQKLTTDLVMNIGMEMLNQNLPDSTKLFDVCKSQQKLRFFEMEN